jgi:adenylate cyclase
VAAGAVTEPDWALATVLFADLRGFTSFAERVTAREAVARLNDVFATIIPAVDRHGGWPHKLLGDGLLAIFGAREGPDRQADRALAAGLEMVAAVEDLRVGINSGLVLVGAIGAAGLVEHGVIGDPVNVAARVQDATRALGASLLVTEATRRLLEDPVELEEMGTLELRGRARPVTLSGRRAATTVGCSS